MQPRTQAALALVTLAALTTPAQAQLARSFSAATYTGVGVSAVEADFDNLKTAYNLDAIGGYNITPAQPWGRIAAELNLSVTVAPGENQGTPGAIGGGGGGGGLIGGGGDGGGGGDTASGRNTQSQDDLQTFILNLQAIYRTPGRFYGIGSVGYSLINTSIQEIEDRGAGSVSFGGGAGFKFGEETAAVEVMYTRVSEDLQTIGVRFVY